MRAIGFWMCCVGILAMCNVQAGVAQEDPVPAEEAQEEDEATAEQPTAEAAGKSQLSKDIHDLEKKVDDLNDALRASGVLETARLENRADCNIATGLCTPQSVGLNGDTKTSIVLTGLSSFCSVHATANETFSEPILNDDVLEAEQLNREALPDQVLLELHLNTLLMPSYGGFAKGRHHKNAIRRLRPTGVDRHALSLLVHQAVRSVVVTATGCKGQPPKTATAVFPVSVSKWEIEGGGFYAFSRASDETLVSKPLRPPPRRTGMRACASCARAPTTTTATTPASG